MQHSDQDKMQQAQERKIPLRELITWPRKTTDEKYPWDEWFDGSVWRLKMYDDFHVSCESMRSAIYMAAQRKKIKVKTHIPKTRDYVYVQKLK